LGSRFDAGFSCDRWELPLEMCGCCASAQPLCFGQVMSRETCYRCFCPKALCWCASIQPMATRTKFVFLMHPKEYKQETAVTGRLTHLCLSNSELHVGVE